MTSVLHTISRSWRLCLRMHKRDRENILKGVTGIGETHGNRTDNCERASPNTILSNKPSIPLSHLIVRGANLCFSRDSFGVTPISRRKQSWMRSMRWSKDGAAWSFVRSSSILVLKFCSDASNVYQFCLSSAIQWAIHSARLTRRVPVLSQKWSLSGTQVAAKHT